MTELFNLNREQKRIYCFDIVGLYTHVRVDDEYYYPVGKPIEKFDVEVSKLKDIIGLVVSAIVNDTKSTLGIPKKQDNSFERYRGIEEIGKTRSKGREERKC
jgi:hypothetical protein